MDSQKPDEIKVVDRRRFDAEGEEKPEGNVKPGQDEQRSDPAQRNKQSPQSPYEEVSYAGFIMGLGTQALSLLGEIPNPETNISTVNLDGARQIIDVLAMLVEKTKGNLTALEDQLTTEILASLRIAYVKKHDELKK